MPVASFESLVSGLRELIGPNAPEVSFASGVMSFEYFHNGVRVTLAYAEHVNADSVFTFIEFGSVPREREADIWRVLMEANFMLYRGRSPMFASNPGTQKVQLEFESVLAEISVNTVWHSIECFSELAHRWRDSFFLEDEAPRSLGAAVKAAPAQADFA